MRELLIFLENCPSEFKSDVASNIVISAGRYAPNAQWHIDTILKVFCLYSPDLKFQGVNNWWKLRARPNDPDPHSSHFFHR